MNGALMSDTQYPLNTHSIPAQYPGDVRAISGQTDSNNKKRKRYGKFKIIAFLCIMEQGNLMIVLLRKQLTFLIIYHLFCYYEHLRWKP
jgi:hypothetical protein